MPASSEAPAEETIREYLETLSNWGRWGSEDEPDTTFQPMRFMVDSGEGRDTVSPARARQRRGA